MNPENVPRYKKTGADLVGEISKQRLDFLLAASPAVIYTAIPTGDYPTTFISANVLSQIGYEAKAFIDDPKFWASHIHPDDASRVFADLPKLFELGYHNHDYRFLAVNGCYRWIHDQLRLIRDSDGTPTEIIGCLLDITDRKLAEQEQRETENLFRTLFEQAAVGVAQLETLTGTLKRVNQRYRDIVGYEVDELLSLNFQSITHPDDLQADLENMQRLVSGDIRSFSMEKRLLRKDRSYVWVQLTVSPMWAPSAQPDFHIAVIEDITERKAADEALKRSETTLQFALEASTDGLWDWNVETGEVFFSPRWLQTLGYAQGDLEPHVGVWESLIHAEDFPRVRDALEAHFSKKTPLYECENRLRTKAGTYRWNLVRGKVVAWDEEGKPLRMIGVDADITERKKADEALRASEERYRSIVETAHEGIWILDANACTTFVNRRMAEMLGVTSEEMIGRKLTDFMDDQGRSEALRNLERRAQGIAEDHEFRFVRRDGSNLWTICSTNPIHDDKGQYIGALGMILDITDRKRDEDLIRAKNKMLEGLAHVQRQFLTEDDPRQWFDRVLALLLETTSSEYGFIAELDHPSSGEPFLRSLAISNIAWNDETRGDFEKAERTGLEFHNLENLFGAAITTGKAVIANDARHDPCRGGLLPGHPSMQSFLGIPFFHGEEMIGMIGIANRPDGYDENCIQSLTPILATCSSLVHAYHLECQRRDSEKERHKLQTQVLQVQKMESLGILAGGIAHDFNNLLTSILGYCDLARLELPPDSQAHEYIGKSIDGARRAAELTQQMLAYSGRGHFVVGRANLSTLTEDMTRLLEISISKKCVVRYHLHKALPAIEADSAQLRQVIMNLIINASDSIGEQSGVISVSTGVQYCDRKYLLGSQFPEPRPEGWYVFLEVKDTGCGMSPETIAKIFDPFFTTKFIGRGLGLAAVHGIVRGHRGAIIVDSELGKGTSFRVLFPALTEFAAADTRTGVDESVWQGNGTVLLVDDEDSVRNVARNMLESLGFTVVTAANGIKGVELFRSDPERFCLVLLDMTMPHMNGDEALHEIRGIRPNALVILSSGYNEETAAERLTGSAPDGFIQKPYRLAQLRSLIGKLLDDGSSS